VRERLRTARREGSSDGQKQETGTVVLLFLTEHEYVFVLVTKWIQTML